MKKLIKYFIVFFILNSPFLVNNCVCQWVQMSNGIYGEIIYSLAVSGNNIFAGTSQYGVYLSTNNGISWTQTTLNNKIVRAIAISGNNIFAGTNQYGVYLSTNNGDIWSQTTLNNQIINAFAISGNNIFAGTSQNGVYLSTNDGTNWTQTALNNKTIMSLAVSSNIIYAGTENIMGGIYLSSNNGTSWAQTSLNDKTIMSLATLGNSVFAGTFNYGIYQSINNGISWTQTSLTNKNVYSLAINGNNIFAGISASSSSNPSGFYYSTNNGLSWIEKSEGFSPTLFEIQSIKISNNYFIIATNISVWRRPLLEILNVQNISTEIPDNFSLNQNYPNPFNPSTKIRYDLPRAGVMRLAVYDVMGREVELLVNERQAAGSYEAVWDGTRFASGVYFYRLTAEGFNETRKMILIR